MIQGEYYRWMHWQIIRVSPKNNRSFPNEKLWLVVTKTVSEGMISRLGCTYFTYPVSTHTPVNELNHIGVINCLDSVKNVV